VKKRRQYHRAHTGNRRRTTIYIDADLLDLIKEFARARNISLCDWIEGAIRMRAGIEGLLKITEHRKGGLTVKSITVHKVERLRREPEPEPGFEPGKLLCPNCGSSDIEHKPKRTPFSYNGSYYECIRCEHYFSRWG